MDGTRYSEALSLGVPIVVMPQWTDQTTNAKLIMDVWKVGVKIKLDESGIVAKEQIELCIKEVIEGERGKEMKMNSVRWKELAKEVVRTYVFHMLGSYITILYNWIIL